MSNILMQKAFDDIKEEARKMAKSVDEANGLRFNDDATKADMAEKINYINYHSNEGCQKIIKLLDGAEELLNMQKVMSR